jgi:hypothetical protein
VRVRTPADGALHGAPRRRPRAAAAAAGPADCAGPVQLRARTACYRRALMQSALFQFSYARGLPAAPELSWPALSLLV